MVAVASTCAPTRKRATGWLVASLIVLMLGTVVRLAARPIDIAAVSAAVLAALLWLGVWLVALLLGTPRGAFAVALVAMLVLDLAAVPPRTLVDYDDRQALHRTDQTLSVRVPPGGSGIGLVLQVEPVFEGPQPRFGLAGDAGGTPVEWSCRFRRGMQRVVLPLPAGTTEVSLRVTGSPDHEREYLIVYTRLRGEPVGEAALCP